MTEQTLCEQLGATVQPTSKIVPQILEELTDEQEQTLLLAASPPATVEELAERSGLTADAVGKMVDPLFTKGLLFKSKKKDAIRYYRFRNLMQLHDATGVAIDAPRKVLDLWKEHTQTEWIEWVNQLEGAIKRPVLRVIPVNESIEQTSQVMAFEDLKELVDGATTLAVTKCSCRAIDGACGLPIDVCIQVDRAADYAIERGTGRGLTRPETMDMLRQCAEDGLVAVSENKRGLGMVICNCCGDCCINWTSLKHGSRKFAAPSRYRATVTDDDCNGCEVCIERCYFDALAMNDDAIAVINEENCMGCGLCQVACPTEAIAMELTRDEEFVPAA
jgi:NAD-dependent dihydropyrimidine dehydrogenase PreA subunit/predicted transcriptional regulator